MEDFIAVFMQINRVYFGHLPVVSSRSPLEFSPPFASRGDKAAEGLGWNLFRCAARSAGRARPRSDSSQAFPSAFPAPPPILLKKQHKLPAFLLKN